MGNFITTVLTPIEWLVAWIMYGWHQLFTTIGLPAASGWTWGLSIVGLVIVMRAAMIPLFVRQIHASRKMQLIQPELQKIQAKYKGKSDPDSRQALTSETMELYKRTGTNPFSSCLPILLQSPFFFGLFRVLNGLSAISKGPDVDGGRGPIGPITKAVASQAEHASLFGAELSSKFVHAPNLSTQIVTVLLIILMSASTFTTQRQLMMKNMPASALDNPFAKQQKVLLYVMPLFFAVSGINFPIGVLLYWFTTNVWSMLQQFYVIRRMPAPGSPADKAMRERHQRRGTSVKEITVKGLNAEAAEAPAAPEKPTGGQRQQPKGKKRAKGSGARAPEQNGSSGSDSKPDSDGTDAAPPTPARA